MSEIEMLNDVVAFRRAEEDIRVVIDNAFSVVVPKGMNFSTDPEDIGNDKFLAMFSPISESLLDELSDINCDSFNMQYLSAQTKVRFDAEHSVFSELIDLGNPELREMLKKNFVDGLAKMDIMTGGEGLPEDIVVARSDEKAIVVANTHGFLGTASFLVCVSSGYYHGMYHVASYSDVDGSVQVASSDEYRVFAENLLSTIECIDGVVNAVEEELEPLRVAELSYDDQRRITVRAISVPVPDATICACADRIDEADGVIPNSLEDRMDFICVPKEYSKGFAGYQDASMSIYIAKAQIADNADEVWNNSSLDEVASQFLHGLENNIDKQEKTQKPKIVIKKDNIISVYGRYSGDDTEDSFWRSYFFAILTRSTFIQGMFYFNQKASDEEFDEVVKQWLSGVNVLSDEEVQKSKIEISRELFEVYGDDNGKLDMLVIAKLFAEDVLFLPEKQLERNGNAAYIDLQINEPKLAEHPLLARHESLFAKACFKMFIELDNAKELQVSADNLNQNILRVLLDDRLTGFSFLNLMAYHMVIITEAEEDENCYFVAVDRNVFSAIPDAYSYICKFIKFAREYNQKSGEFVV